MSNPPYISPTLFADLPASVRAHEDRLALTTSDADGMALVLRVLALTSHLTTSGASGPRLVVEFGGDAQCVAVQAALAATPWLDRARTAVRPDQYGVPRWFTAY